MLDVTSANKFDFGVTLMTLARVPQLRINHFVIYLYRSTLLRVSKIFQSITFAATALLRAVLGGAWNAI